MRKALSAKDSWKDTASAVPSRRTGYAALAAEVAYA